MPGTRQVRQDTDVLTMGLAELIQMSNEMRSLQPASKYQVGYLNYFLKRQKPIVGTENFLAAQGDLKAVRPKGDRVWLDEWMLHLLIQHARRSRILKVGRQYSTSNRCSSS